MKISMPAIGRISITLLAVAAALFAAVQLWKHYELEPWTRDGRVKTNVVQVAPDITGLVTNVHVRDNQAVKAGDVLFDVDRARFELALRQAQAAVQAQQTALAQAEKEARRNVQLRDLVAQEAREQSLAKVDQIRAALEQAVVSRDVARLNLDRTRVVSPVSGYVTNLDLQAGAYVSAGRAVLAVVDRNGFYVEGYFEETKLGGIHVGDRARVVLMGHREALAGRVESIAEGIFDRDRSTGSNLLPNINPTFNWVRLAQRIPVRIALDGVPAGVRLIAGQTATVAVLPSDRAQADKTASAKP
ncbi:efflux RND transporter periplasmic adaptor subunit [Noviherbaspirillum malthae]|uniref:efflux RND transporter periplasmic adaptor subunit n=1 Tax=Noviherbaspirillum malthae TaxID=1260987 RepID=UPI00188FFB5A|nr:HlyD family secretion protein [Noviherbaspirillum malthae]